MSISLSQGILGSVTVQAIDGNQFELHDWNVTGFPLTNYDKIDEFVKNSSKLSFSSNQSSNSPILLRNGPIMLRGKFSIPQSANIADTYLDPSEWGKVSYIFMCSIYLNTNL